MRARCPAVLASLLTMALAAGMSCASTADGQAVINACYSFGRDAGELRFVNPGARCALSETPLSWNKAGVRGPIGQGGAKGEVGAQGEKGDEGEAGERGPPGEAGGSSFKDILEEVVKIAAIVIAAAVTALLALYLSGLLLLQLLTRVPRVKDWRPMSCVRRPTLLVEMLDDRALAERLGPAITGLVRGRISVREDRFGLEYVSGQRAVSKALEQFKDLSGTAKSAVALIGYLSATLPRRHFVLCGELQPPGQAGPGVSLALRREDGYDSLTALWAAPLEVHETGAAAYQRLAIPAAAWADHRITRALGGKLLSSDPLSWAFFRAGLESHRLGDDGSARSLYEQALGHDGRNAGALANLGLLERRERHFDRAEDLLSRALRELK
jgi:tetratricopeptide (TPR) repeat protein